MWIRGSHSGSYRTLKGREEGGLSGVGLGEAQRLDRPFCRRGSAGGGREGVGEPAVVQGESIALVLRLKDLDSCWVWCFRVKGGEVEPALRCREWLSNGRFHQLEDMGSVVALLRRTVKEGRQ
jgi:hypothetical protein